LLFAVAASVGLSASADPVYQGNYRCDTWHRRYADGTKYRYSDHNTPSSNQVPVGDPVENTLIRTPDSSSQHPEYVLQAKDGWAEAIGGGGYGSHGYPYPAPDTGEGGTVQGNVKPTEASGQDVNFSVSSFSADDNDNRGDPWGDTYTNACVSYNGQTASVGKTPTETRTYNSTTQTGCDTTHQTRTNNCWAGPTGHCDATGAFCDQGLVVPTHLLNLPTAGADDQIENARTERSLSRPLPPRS
jgi:hypothetical protein